MRSPREFYGEYFLCLTDCLEEYGDSGVSRLLLRPECRRDRMTMIELPAAMTQQKIIAVARNQDERTAPSLAGALGAGGLTVLEITVEGERGIEAIAAVAGGSTVLVPEP